jgi:hypothetical protein
LKGAFFMAMVCPQCNDSFQQRMDCPHCKVRLHYRLTRHAPVAGILRPDEDWQQTPWGRLVVGLLLAQGLYHVLHHLCTAGLLATVEGAPLNVWATLTGIIVLQALQAVGVLAAGLLVGAGQRRGYLLGAVTGVWNGVLFVLIQHWTGTRVTTISLLGEPILQAAFGAVGGTVGSLIWAPIPVTSHLKRGQHSRGTLSPAPVVRSSFAGPIAWGRVLTGITVAVGGVVWVDVIRDLVLEASGGRLQIDTHLQAELVTWEISALAIVAGSLLAGATTANGMKQGLAVGIGTATVLFGERLASAMITPQLLMLTLTSAISLSLVGGWFGSQMLPPVLGPARRRRVTAAPV